MDFEQRVFQFIRDNKLMTARGQLLLGVSGGADSMALLACLSRLRHQLGVSLHAVHFNHRFRAAALRDERFVEGWCRKWNVPLTVGRRQGAVLKHLSEDQARRMRFQFFVDTARRLKVQSVALAHTRNDLAETVLMRLMRGSGLYGLRAILPERRMQGVSFVRPLLGVDRMEVEKYLKARRVPFCTDHTNQKTVYERNKVRLKLLPLLAREYNPQIVQVLSDLAATAGEDYEFLNQHAARQFKKINTVSSKKVKIALKDIQARHPAIIRLVLRRMAEILTGDVAALSFEHVHAMEKALDHHGPTSIDLPAGMRAVKTMQSLELIHV